MRSNPVYIKIKKANLTAEQVSTLDITGVEAVAGKPDKPIFFLNNLKKCLLKDLQTEQNKADEAKIRSTLDAGFPDWKKTARGKKINTNLTDIEVVR